MKIAELQIRNFRLLNDVKLSLDAQTTVIVGRNNSGKTSLTELTRRLLGDKSPNFRLEDFSLSAHDDFWKAFKLFSEGAEESVIRGILPQISVRLKVKYDPAAISLGALSDFIIDLDPAPKNANFRSVPKIVNVLNAMRPDLTQEVDDPAATGTAVVYHTNNWAGARRTGAHWAGDLPSERAHDYLSHVWLMLEREGWNFSPDQTKVLMLTHNVLAEEQGYRNLADVFSNNEAYIKKEDKYLAFFMDFLEPMCIAFSEKKYGEMFSIIGKGKQGINAHSTKVEWTSVMNDILRLRATGTIGDVLDYITEKRKPRLPDSIENSERKFKAYVKDETAEEEPRDIIKIRKLRSIAYSEVIAVTKFVNDHTPFATKHSIKGEQFKNVLIVVGRGWNQYNFDQMLSWFGNVPGDRVETFERSRNLFYVACSRPQTNLAILFTQILSPESLTKLQAWFGNDHVMALEAVIPTQN